jgi:hypothetical protein
VTHTFGPGRRGYIFVVSGELKVNGNTLKTGDQVRISGEPKVEFAGPSPKGRQGNGESVAPADFLFLDLP